jgi:hypothetical protein
MNSKKKTNQIKLSFSAKIIKKMRVFYKLSHLGVVPTRKTLGRTLFSKSAKFANPEPPELSPKASALDVILGA